MIYLMTGQPGHGKTLRAVMRALEWVKQGRVVYAMGVRGLKYEEAGFLRLERFEDWMKCPPGSAFLIDECYTVMPRRSSAQKVPPHVEKLATHRHEGFDFIFVCQSPAKQVDSFVHDLVDQHEHVRRKYGFKAAVVLMWDRYMSNVKTSDRKQIWKYPSDLMRRNLYESTVEDTTKKSVPWFYYALPVVALGVWFAWRHVVGFFHPEQDALSESQGKASLVAQAASMSTPPPANARPDDFQKWLTPRIEGQPWTAPAYDSRPVVAEPEIYCMLVETDRGKDCKCITEQGTRYQLNYKICKVIAEEGTYNPTRRVEQDVRPRHAHAEAAPPMVAPIEASLSTKDALGTLRASPRVGSSYAPPESTKVSAIGGG